MSAILFLTLFSTSTMDSIGIKKENGKEFIVHQIDKGQTLSAISRRYGVPVQQIIDQNKILPDKIQLGQIILIPSRAKINATNSQKTEIKPTNTQNKANEPKPTAPTKTNSSTNSKVEIKLKTTTRKGLVGLGKSDVLDPISFTALHPTLPPQSLVKVVNSENGRIVFVRVVGKTTGELKIFDLVISQAAMDQLRVLGDKLQAELTFGLSE